MASPRLLSSILILSPLAIHAQIDKAVMEHSATLPNLTENAWSNPSLLSEIYRSSLSSVNVTFHNSSKERFGEFKAESYMKLKKVAVKAHALYNNGARHNVRFCENVDIDKVYPYLTYDAVGGNMNLERYSFGGSVGVNLSGRWDVGGSLSYDAGLFYRNVDPRPRIITGDFCLGAGASYALGEKYKIGAGINYEKYKQSCDITFMSELGESKIYHLTGLGSHYSRFAGQGNSTYYNGNSIDASLTFLPIKSGAYINLSAQFNKINLILEDLNKLPMSLIDSRTFRGEAGYKGNCWGVIALAEIERKHGYENIFGDATTGQYPQIGSIAMHIINRNRYGVNASADLSFKNTLLSLNPEIVYNHYNEIYRDPRRSLKCDNLSSSINVKATSVIANKVVAKAGVQYILHTPISHSMENVGSDIEDLHNFISILNDGYNLVTHATHNYAATIGADLMICKNRYAIGIDLSYSGNKISGNNSRFTLSFIF
ncbi:MAG: hypothetical protein K2K97_08225 [Muribaculaceae bacterium]|nr:hypothetical protein [Muribaculaceae bacterium]